MRHKNYTRRRRKASLTIRAVALVSKSARAIVRPSPLIAPRNLGNAAQLAYSSVITLHNNPLHTLSYVNFVINAPQNLGISSGEGLASETIYPRDGVLKQRRSKQWARSACVCSRSTAVAGPTAQLPPIKLQIFASRPLG